MRDDLRRLWFRIVLALDVAAALIASLFVLAVYLAPWAMSRVGDAELRERLYQVGRIYANEVDSGLAWPIVAAIAALLLLGNLLWLIYGGAPATPPSHIQSASKDGVIRISRDAVESALRQRGEQVEGVSRVRVALEPSPGPRRVRLRVSFHCIDDADVGLVGGEMRSAIRTRVVELVHLPEGHRLDLGLEFLGFVQKSSKRLASDAKASAGSEGEGSGGGEDSAREDPVEPFTGPRYPVEDDWRDA